jgi:predicted Zn-dependent protease
MTERFDVSRNAHLAPSMGQRWRTTALAAAVVMALAGCATGTKSVNPVSGQVERSVMDERAEVAEGSKAHPQIVAEYGELNNPRLQAYVTEVGMRIARASERPNLPWKFTVLDSPEVNAFALPGGYVYITRGIMAYLQSEADMAGVLGHEVGHVTARHGVQRATRAEDANKRVMAATVLGVLAEVAGVRGAAQMASQGSQAWAANKIGQYSQGQESQADQLGAAYLQKLNFDPRNMVDVIAVLRDQERFAMDRARAEGKQVQQGGGYTSTHPANDKRLTDITAISQRYTGRYVDEGRQRYLQAMQGVNFGDSREQGVVRGRTFYHEPMGFVFTAPQGWKIDNDSDSLTFIAPDGTAGLIVNPVPAKAGNTHEEILKNAVKAVSGRTEARNLNGFRATHFQGLRAGDQGRQERITTTIVTGPNNTNYALIYAAKDDAAFGRHQAGLRETEASFRAITQADRGPATPYALRLVAYPRGGFAELARSSPLGADAERQLRLLNGFYGGGEPKVGDVVKVVGQ